jgi:hypothetical protein
MALNDDFDSETNGGECSVTYHTYNPITPFASIIFSEYLYVIWIYRKDVAFKRKSFVLSSLISFYKCRLRNRVKLDYARLDKEKFKEYWFNRPIPITESQNEIVFGF